MKKKLILGVLLALFALVALRPELLMWVLPIGSRGQVNVVLRFHVLEAASRTPISKARLQVVPDQRLAWLADTNLVNLLPATNTDNAGLAQLTIHCDAERSRRFFASRDYFWFSHQLLVAADGYQSVSNALERAVGQREWPLSKRVIDVEVLLTRSP